MRAAAESTRRAVLAGLAGALSARPARGQDSDFGAAARYSAERRGVSLLVMRCGEVLFEDYPNEGGPERAWELASGTKSFSGIIAAAAAADGLLDLDEPAALTLPEWRDDAPKASATLRQLLTLTSGIVDRNIARAPTYAAALGARLEAEPGRRFAYGPTPFQIFGEIMRRKLLAAGGPADAPAYLRERVLDLIGVDVARWRTHRRDGLPLMPQGAQLTARDWARFGQYVLDGAPGLDRATFAACFEPTAANPGYGLTWWLLQPGLIPPAQGAGVAAEDISDAVVREDIVMAAGAGNQRLYLLRARELVVVRQASGIFRARRGPEWRDGEFLRTLAT